jgi:hypothetical protein
MIHTNSSNKPQSKRQQIWKLASEGVPPKEIALRVNTSVENVWKEKSLLKSRAGLIVSRSTTQQSKKQSEMILFDPEGEQRDRSVVALQKIKSRKSTGLSDYLIDIPQLNSEGLRTLYRELKSGKKPIDILAEHGFHPEAVEIEYRRFIELSERDIDELLKRIMLNMIQKGYDKESIRNINTKTLIDLYRQRGHLTNDEILELLALYTKEEVQREIELSLLDPDGRLPRGFRRLRCGNCEKSLGVIVLDKLPISRELVEKYDGKALCHACLAEMNSGDGY